MCMSYQSRRVGFGLSVKIESHLFKTVRQIAVARRRRWEEGDGKKSLMKYTAARASTEIFIGAV